MKAKKIAKIILAAGILLVALYFMPFITVTVKDNQDRLWRVPFASWFVDDDGSTLSFSSIRSSYALSKDTENALHSYTEKTCYGKTYYYSEENDVSIASYSVENSRVTYAYEAGDACLGWSDDDEIAWQLGDIKEISDTLTAQEAIDNDWFVIEDGIAQNPGIYNDFSRLVKQGVYSALRTMVVEGDETTYIDIQLLEEPVIKTIGDNSQEAYYKVTTRKGSEVSEEYYTRYSETTSTNPRIVSVYNKDEEGIEQEVQLFIYQIE